MTDAASVGPRVRRKLLKLLLVALGCWVLVVVPLGVLKIGPPVAVSGIAVALCLIPGLLALWLDNRSRGRSPEEKVVVMLVATALRMLVGVGGAILLFFASDLIRTHAMAFITCLVIFYLLTLGIEIGLQYREHQPSEPSMGS